MPGVVLTVSGQPDKALSHRLADEVSRVTCAALRKERERTTVIVRFIPRDQWFIAGQSLAEYGKNAFKLKVTITDETNTREEKAAFHEAAFNTLSDLIGDLHPHSNIHVIDCRATAYGYGGITQDRRYHQAGAWR